MLIRRDSERRLIDPHVYRWSSAAGALGGIHDLGFDVAYQAMQIIAGQDSAGPC